MNAITTESQSANTQSWLFFLDVFQSMIKLQEVIVSKRVFIILAEGKSLR
jgi:hypothetical protein